MAYELLSFEGIIKGDTFHVTASHCRFQLDNITLLPPYESLQVTAIPTTEIVYWGELANFTNVLRYKVDIRNARLRKYKGKLQYNVDIGSLLILSKELVPSSRASTDPAPSSLHTIINTSICSLLEIQDVEIITRFDQLAKAKQLGDYADVVNEYPMVQNIIPIKKQQLFERMSQTPGHLHAYCFLFHYNIPIPWNDDAKQTVALADIIHKNPYLVMTAMYYGQFTHYETFSFERLECLAEQILGPLVTAKTGAIRKARAVAAAVDVIQHEEQQNGHTWTTIETVHRLLCTKLKQPPWVVKELLDNFNALQFLVTSKIDGGVINTPLDDQTVLQRPETKEKEDDLLAWFVFLNRKLSVRSQPIDEAVLESVLDRIYLPDRPRDSHQIAAIRMGIEKPVSCISGPPGCGKTTYVVRAIVGYFEQKFRHLYDVYTQQLSDRTQADEENIEKEMMEYVQGLRQRYRISGNFDEENRATEFADQFDTWMERTQGHAAPDRQKLHIREIYRMTAHKLYELKYKKYVRLQSSSDLSMVKLVAPSGVAARRLSDACDGHVTHTCCSLIGQLQEDNLKADPGYKDFFPFKLLIVDEASMVDLDMVSQIMQVAEQEKVQLIFLGDPHQLPPIGAGQFFRDVLATRRLPHTALEKIYRQGVGSNIAELSKAIVTGEDASIPLLQEAATHLTLTDLSFGSAVIDTFFAGFGSGASRWDILNITIPPDANMDWAPLVARIYRHLLIAQAYVVNSVKILTPFREGNGGRFPLNEVLQQEILQLRIERNGGNPIDQQFYARFKTYDPVIHRKNTRKLNIYNGDLGFVLPQAHSGEMKALVVQYPHKQLFYTPSGNTKQEIATMKDLELAYAMTCHSAQGSQFNYVIVVLPRFLNHFTTALMINTLISRAKSRLVLISEETVLEQCLKAKYTERRTRLGTMWQAICEADMAV